MLGLTLSATIRGWLSWCYYSRNGQTLPAGLNLTAEGDQSAVVIDGVSGVVRERLIAACLTGLMILLFLPSWHSTLIITVSIPLSVLASLAFLSALGETNIVMTLGGWALAVGILVDEATVTIENLNWHLKQGKEIEPAILDGAQQIVVPATVSMLCISIAFMAMFGIGGVAGYLFRPLAEAVVSAMVASYLLSRTLVRTMAKSLLRHQPAHSGASRNPFAIIQRRFEQGFEAVRSAYVGLLHLGLDHRGALIAGFLGFTVLSLALAPSLGQDFFPEVDTGQIKLHVRAPTGTRIEDTVRLADRVGETIREVIPPAELDGVVDNIGLSVSGINVGYNNSDTIGDGEGDILISLSTPDAPVSQYIKAVRDVLPSRFPGAQVGAEDAGKAKRRPEAQAQDGQVPPTVHVSHFD